MTWICEKCGKDNDAPHGFFDMGWGLVIFAGTLAMAIALFQLWSFFRWLCGFGG